MLSDRWQEDSYDWHRLDNDFGQWDVALTDEAMTWADALSLATDTGWDLAATTRRGTAWSGMGVSVGCLSGRRKCRHVTRWLTAVPMASQAGSYRGNRMMAEIAFRTARKTAAWVRPVILALAGDIQSAEVIGRQCGFVRRVIAVYTDGAA